MDLLRFESAVSILTFIISPGFVVVNLFSQAYNLVIIYHGLSLLRQL